MENKKKIYIFGSKTRPNEVKKTLEEYGGTAREGIIFTKEQCLYFINHKGRIVYAYPNTELANMITEYYKKIELPDPSESWENGDILVDNNGLNKFFVLDKLGGHNSMTVYLSVTKKPEGYYEPSIDASRHIVYDSQCHKADDDEIQSFYTLITLNGRCWDAFHKELLCQKNQYHYPKNGHYYTAENIVRCKDRTTGEWYDAVLYNDNNGQYVREANDFYRKFIACY